MWGAWCIFILCQLVSLPVIRSEEAFHLRDRHDNLRYRVFNDKNLVTSEDKAEEVLARYGYLKCDSRRQKRSLFSGFLNVIPDEGGRTSISRTCSKMEVENAIKNYQKTYNMPQTGRLDSDTLRVMSESRCGNSDDESSAVPFQPLSNVGLKHDNFHVSRSKRETSEPSTSLHDFIMRAGKEPTSNYGSLPGTTLSRRLHWMEEYGKQIESGAFDQKLEKIHDYIQSRRRKKRSLAIGIQGHAFSSELVTWRLVESAYSSQLTINTQRKALALAFRMWGEVIPLLFQEDTRSRVDDVDILIAFGRGEHLNCPNHFDGFGGQLAHAVKLTGNTEIHVDDDEYLTLGSEHGINLIKVVVHEVGHSLGMFHISRNYSIMYAIYSRFIPNNNFELGWEDRKMVQKMYGICEGRFDTVFDWVRRRPDGNIIYNTYFFRSNQYWMYENRFNRTRYGDPLNIIPEWKGIPNNVDAFVHVWTYTQDNTYFFKGRHYYLYNSAEDKVAPGYPREISKDFRGIPGSRFPSIPSNIDAVFFDQRDSNLYFFKGKYVYAYDTERGNEGCCLPGYPREIKLEFPSASPKSKLPSNLDAIYYSYFNRAMYFFKGKLFWENKAFNPLDRKRKNEIVGPWPISSKWYDICEVEL
ncbi:matrix metalloproteinase-21-like [Limulus polyphemus]|uniref:Matrix metalloproteinase-21-like n=1 Tax=Limulus polyphemus TaxID=6850 RepID=A0ABM1BNN2_LIMPO|nr:matrix metalloproteinase-21-like [Limulus polyphemus]XP_022253981.1 matrix metalloproteinase-21-like [Limulus polyphemus]